MEIDLSAFCYREDDRYFLKQPWTRGDFTYATDGRIMIRTPARADIIDIPSAPNINPEDFPFRHSEIPSSEWLAIPEVLPPSERITCTCCKGKAVRYRHGDETTQVRCSECDGKGFYLSAVGVYFRKIDRIPVKLSEIYLAILQKLPCIRIAPFAQAATEPCPFMASEALGYLMPMREL